MTDCKMSTTLQEFIYYVMESSPYSSEDDRTPKQQFLQKFLPAVMADKDFTITLETMACWLGSDDNKQQRTLKRLLDRHFVKGRDYVEVAGNAPSKIDVLLSGDCMKQLAMMSRSKHSDRIRAYFIQMDKAYRDFLLDAIEDRASSENPKLAEYKLKGPRPRTDFPVGHCVYVVEVEALDDSDGTTPTYKIGRTANLNDRFARLFRTLPNCTRVAHYKMLPEHRFMENCVRMGLGKLKSDGDAFDTTLEVAIGAIEACAVAKDNVCAAVGTCKLEEGDHSYLTFF